MNHQGLRCECSATKTMKFLKARLQDLQDLVYLRPRKNVFKFPAFFYRLNETKFGHWLLGPLFLPL